MRKELKSISGVYAFWHNQSDSVYIGSSINLASRAMNHVRNNSSNIYLQNAIAKHGLNNFSFFVLELLPENCYFYDDLLDLEQKYLDLFETKYNFDKIARKSRAGAIYTEEAKRLLSQQRRENYTEERRKQVSDQLSKELFLYEAKTFNLIKKYSKQEELVKELNVSWKTVIKYRDSGDIFRDKYILTSKLINEGS